MNIFLILIGQGWRLFGFDPHVVTSHTIPTLDGRQPHYFLQVFNKRRSPCDSISTLTLLPLHSLQAPAIFGDKIHRCIFLLSSERCWEYSYVRTIKVLCQINKTFPSSRFFFRSCDSKVKSAREPKSQSASLFSSMSISVAFYLAY